MDAFGIHLAELCTVEQHVKMLHDHLNLVQNGDNDSPIDHQMKNIKAIVLESKFNHSELIVNGNVDKTGLGGRSWKFGQ